MRRHLLLPLALAVASTPGQAQRERTLEVSRQLRDTAEHRVRVEYTAGRFRLEPTTAPVLYAMTLHYDEDRGDPVHEYDADTRSLEIGLSRRRTRLSTIRRDEAGEMSLGLSPRIPMELTLDLGATDADADLTGLRLSSLRVNAGAAELDVRFDRPNPVAMRALDVDVGAAKMTIHGVANANASDVSVNVGAGEIVLDFDGAWSRDIDADVNVALGHLVLRVPRDVGIRLEVDRVLASFDRSGLERRGNAYVSANFDDARHRLRVKADVVLGNIDVEHR